MIIRLVRTIRVVVLLCGGSRALVLENLALRQQFGMYQRGRPKPAVRRTDRWFWVGLCRLWPGWATALVVLRPATVIGWHRRGFAWYWTRRLRTTGGRPRVNHDLQHLIHQLVAARQRVPPSEGGVHPTWESGHATLTTLPKGNLNGS